VTRARFTHHPDEEGTERRQVQPGRRLDVGASHTIPMKRELKVILGAVNQHRRHASHTIPMKRELKAAGQRWTSGRDAGFTHHPDEEGTERSRAARMAIEFTRFTHHPDEEGTERK